MDPSKLGFAQAMSPPATWLLGCSIMASDGFQGFQWLFGWRLTPFSIKNSHLYIVYVVYPFWRCLFIPVKGYKCGRGGVAQFPTFPRWEGGFAPDPTTLVQTCGCFTARHRFGVRRSGEPHGRQCRLGWDAPLGLAMIDTGCMEMLWFIVDCRHVPISWNSGWFTWSWWVFLTYDPYASSLKSDWFQLTSPYP